MAAAAAAAAVGAKGGGGGGSGEGEGDKSLRMAQMRAALEAHFKAWKSTVTEERVKHLYPTLAAAHPDMLTDMFGTFWEMLEGHVTAEFNLICASCSLPDRLAELGNLAAEVNGTSVPAPLPVAPEAAVRKVAVAAKLKAAADLQRLAATLKAKNDELEAAAFKSAATARGLKSKLQVHVDAFQAVRQPACGCRGREVGINHLVHPPKHMH